MSIGRNELETNELQFALKPGISSSDVVLSIKTIVDYCDERGSSVYAFTPDLRKPLILYRQPLGII